MLRADCKPRSGSSFAVGDHSVRCMVKDSAGGTDQGTIVVIVSKQPRTPVVFMATYTTVSPDGKPVPVDFSVAATDASGVAVERICDRISGSKFAIGKTTITCKARDRAGNEVVHKVQVVVDDATGRIYLSPPLRATATDVTFLPTFGGQSLRGEPVPVRFAVVAYDDSGKKLGVSCDNESGSAFPAGKRTHVICTAHDRTGNAATYILDVFVSNPPAGPH